MSEQTRAITKTDNYRAIQQYGESPEVVKIFSSILGGQGVQYIQSAILAVRANDKLMMCEPKSIFISALRAATLGLSCDPVLGHAFLIPYRNNRTNTYVATFQAGYKGIIYLATGTGKYRYINVSEVWNGEEVVEDRITGDLIISGEAISPKTPIGLIASFALFSGLKKSIYMTNEELEAHGKTYSKNYTDPKSFWQINKPAMYRKTILLRLLRTWGYLSPNHSALLAESDEENITPLELPSESEVTVPETVKGIKFEAPDPNDDYDDGVRIVERPQERVLPTADEPEYPEIVDDTLDNLNPNLGESFMVKDPAKVAEPEPEKPVKSSSGKYTRPMAPEVLKEALATRAQTAKPATEKQAQLVRILLTEFFADKDDVRQQAQEYLTGYRHFADIPPQMITAILDWMKPIMNPDGSGTYVLNKEAKIELTNASRKFMDELGQESLI